MRKVLVLLGFACVVGLGVVYVVEELPRLEKASPAPAETKLMAEDQVPALRPACGFKCGVERWDVKTLSDADRDLVRLHPVDARIEDLITLQRGRVAPGGTRYRPVELTAYRVEGFLGGVSPQDDGDWHVILFGIENQRVSLIAEIPNPDCAGACQSGLTAQFARAREALQERLRQPNPRDEPIRIRVTGVGFFDRNHGQIGAAPNQFELHPVLAIEFP